MSTLTPTTLAAVLVPVTDDPAAHARARNARALVAAFDRVHTVVSARTLERIANAWGERKYPKLARALRHVGAA